MMKEINGNADGMKAWAKEKLLSLYDHRDTNTYLCDDAVAGILCEVTEATNRELSVFLSRKGKVLDVSAGSSNSVVLPVSETGARCIHTHPKGNARLSETDHSVMHTPGIALIAALGVRDGRPTGMEVCFRHPGQNLETRFFHHLHQTAEIMGFLSERLVPADRMVNTGEEMERVLLVGIEEPLDELNELALSAGAVPCARLVQNRNTPDADTYVGKGKLDEMAQLIQIHRIDTVVTDDELTVGQQRKLEDRLQVKVIDRTALILDIFARRAKTREGKLQVELAQLSYMMPRLMGKGKLLSRLGGGIGTRGPGESKLESDRRHISRRIHYLKKELSDVDQRRNLLREKRKENMLFSFSVVGYTNAGKTTLINTLTASSLYAQDLLFATLDPSSRGMRLPSGNECILIDTVGFINKLPHSLVEAFQSTLEEITMSDCIIHVIDASNPEATGQADTVVQILKEIHADHLPVIEVMNKSDVVKGPGTLPTEGQGNKRIGVSALTGQGIQQLMQEMDVMAGGSEVTIDVDVPVQNGELISFIHENAKVLSVEYEDCIVHFCLKTNKKKAARILGSV
ncbi:MAG: GTPase HflX [Clostridia bacterium]